jgi:hypothetical protein
MLYHGSYCIIQQPKLINSVYPKDFGKGFYCTEIKEQAIRWAERNETPVVNIYAYKPHPDLHILEFKTMTEEWLDFIVACRSGTEHNFDIVTGAVANDQIYNYLADYISGILTREQFWILAKFKYPTHQMSFCSNEALNCLDFTQSEIPNDER